MRGFRVIEVKRRSRALHRAAFGCLRDAWVVNVTRGCALGCVYCYARGYPGAPAAGTVELYANLPEQLAMELDAPRRRTRVAAVAFNTASDCFQPDPRVQAVTRDAMVVLLERGVGLSVLTKGWIPESLVHTLAQHPSRVRIEVGIISLEPEIQETFEPRAAPARERLLTIRRLRESGLDVTVRVDPILPFLTDTEGAIRHLLDALAREGIRHLTLSYLHLRPQIAIQFGRELPDKFHRLILGCFAGKPWQIVGTSSRSKLLPATIRSRGYERFRRVADELGLAVSVCACKNPDLAGEACMRTSIQEVRTQPGVRKAVPRQLQLFAELGVDRSSRST